MITHPTIEIVIPQREIDELAQRLGGLQHWLPKFVVWSAQAATAAIKREVLAVTTQESGVPRAIARYRTRSVPATEDNLEAHFLAGKIGWKWGRVAKLGARGKARKVPGGLQVRIGRKTEYIPGGFVAAMPTGHVGVYVRKPGWKSKKVLTDRGPEFHGLPIKETRTQSMTDYVERSGRVPAIVQDALEIFMIRLTTNIDSALAGLPIRSPEEQTAWIESTWGSRR